MKRSYPNLVANLPLVLAAAVLCGLMAMGNRLASAASLAGSSLGLESEMQRKVWDGPVFDLLVGLAIGASVAALFRAYQVLTRPRSAA